MFFRAGSAGARVPGWGFRDTTFAGTGLGSRSHGLGFGGVLRGCKTSSDYYTALVNQLWAHPKWWHISGVVPKLP